VKFSQAILFSGGGAFGRLAAIGCTCLNRAILFSLSLARFRKTLGTMA